jgi:hypothetical protein
MPTSRGNGATLPTTILPSTLSSLRNTTTQDRQKKHQHCETAHNNKTTTNIIQICSQNQEVLQHVRRPTHNKRKAEKRNRVREQEAEEEEIQGKEVKGRTITTNKMHKAKNCNTQTHYSAHSTLRTTKRTLADDKET